MKSPEKYPLAQHSERKKERYIEIPENDDPPPYPGLVPLRAGPGVDVQSSAIGRETSRDFESVGLLHDVEANDVTGSREPRDSVNNVTRGNDGGDGDIARSELKNKSHPKDDDRKKTDIISGSVASRSDVRRIDIETRARIERGEHKSGLPRNELSMINQHDVQSRKVKREDGRETIILRTSTNEITTDV